METSLQTRTKTIAIIGNPNVGKSSIFNQLTGLNQKIGNYPGVTVDKTVGHIKVGFKAFDIIDLPGTYSLYPKSEDEVIAHRVLNGMGVEKPDYVLVILDACNLERSLLLGTQVLDLGIPMAFIINMKDLAEKKGIQIKTHELYKQLGVPMVITDARNNEGMDAIKALIVEERFEIGKPFVDARALAPQKLLEAVQQDFLFRNEYQAFQLLVFGSWDNNLSREERSRLESFARSHGFDPKKSQLNETEVRNQKIQSLLSATSSRTKPQSKSLTFKLDRVFLHPILGYLVFLSIMLLIFQAIFAWASVPMDMIDAGFAWAGTWISENLPTGVLTDLLAEGIVPGIGGVVIFIPQIALLFGFLAFLEDTGYLSRVVFLMDRIMRPFGLHGKSVVPLISGMACAIPGVMATRTISNTKERLITILVTPWMSCSARLPVYVILIGLTVPDDQFWGFNLQAIALLAMYLLGTVGTLLGAFVLKGIIKGKELSYLLTELPIYRLPRWKAVAMTMYNKSKVFVLEAGKVILSISIVLWVLASYGPPSRMDALEAEKETLLSSSPESEWEEIEARIEAQKLENSFIGILGKGIEPVIKPLGYDWKIGIALLTSFAAREVFVGTIATIYSIGNADDELTIMERLAQETNPQTGEKVFNLATGFSLMVFYAFAMQCMSTLAVVYRETKTWKWPILQGIGMTAIAYLLALITYQILS
ncbi:Ferrous iron transport protein B [Mariniradius saccharolyticus AK6]|uniref:Ferrous iron transport protein B n=1 Tax=Mariniradius saccharolyticus AK6 TaxID=1239962 RepID=M7XKH9_9BACT|nr:ferrous iron transport protein B [Mariniradius saccharolyticus]EMS35354.1 Ferrous iron transport protein B [Mariniradius saccharolyticus AK6]